MKQGFIPPQFQISNLLNMAKAGKLNKAKSRKAGTKAKKVKKAVAKKSKKVAAKKSANKKAAKNNPVTKKKNKKIKASNLAKKTVKKVAIKAPAISKKEEKDQQAKVVASVKPVPVLKPEKEKKKTKEELAEEREIMAEEIYSWDSGTFSDMKNYEPTPVFRKPDPPQPKFKGKKDNRTRYSDKELDEFRSIINEKIAEAEKDYELLKNTLAHRDEHGTDDTSPTFKVLEDGSDAMSREEIAQLAARQEKHIQNLKNALIRIEN